MSKPRQGDYPRVEVPCVLYMSGGAYLRVEHVKGATFLKWSTWKVLYLNILKLEPFLDRSSSQKLDKKLSWTNTLAYFPGRKKFNNSKTCEEQAVVIEFSNHPIMRKKMNNNNLFLCLLTNHNKQFSSLYWEPYL